jgi:GAF domain-containing protein
MNPELPGELEPPQQRNAAAGKPAPEAVVDGANNDLAGSLTALSRLSAVGLSLEDLLTRVASIAVRAIPGAEGAGLTLLEPHGPGPDTIVKSDPFVRDIDDIQYGINEGPCISAAANNQVMRSGSLGGDRRWPRFGPRAGRLGVHSVLSLPLLVADKVIGTINVYAHPKNVFNVRAEHLGQLFAEPAAIAVHNANILAQTQRLVSNLQAALTSRAIIDQAIGIIISRTGDTAEQAFDRIRRRSQAEHIKVAVIAQQIVEIAARDAHSQQPGEP